MLILDAPNLVLFQETLQQHWLRKQYQKKMSGDPDLGWLVFVNFCSHLPRDDRMSYLPSVYNSFKTFGWPYLSQSLGFRGILSVDGEGTFSYPGAGR